MKKLLPIIILIFCSLFIFAEKSVEKTDSIQLPRLVDLGAKKCVPCKKMEPILHELTAEYQGQFDVEFIDVWKKENREKAMKYKIRSIPTQIYFDAKGKELFRHTGYISKKDILKKWQELGYSFQQKVEKKAPEQKVKKK